MPARCFVYGCTSGYGNKANQGKKWSFFTPPRYNDALFKKWEFLCGRGDAPLTATSKVCHEHFPESMIIKNSVITIPRGKTITYEYSKWRLKPDAYPCKSVNVSGLEMWNQWNAKNAKRRKLLASPLSSVEINADCNNLLHDSDPQNDHQYAHCDSSDAKPYYLPGTGNNVFRRKLPAKSFSFGEISAADTVHASCEMTNVSNDHVYAYVKTADGENNHLHSYDPRNDHLYACHDTTDADSNHLKICRGPLGPLDDHQQASNETHTSWATENDGIETESVRRHVNVGTQTIGKIIVRMLTRKNASISIPADGKIPEKARAIPVTSYETALNAVSETGKVSVGTQTVGTIVVRKQVQINASVSIPMDGKILEKAGNETEHATTAIPVTSCETALKTVNETRNASVNILTDGKISETTSNETEHATSPAIPVTSCEMALKTVNETSNVSISTQTFSKFGIPKQTQTTGASPARIKAAYCRWKRRCYALQKKLKRKLPPPVDGVFIPFEHLNEREKMFAKSLAKKGRSKEPRSMRYTAQHLIEALALSCKGWKMYSYIRHNCLLVLPNKRTIMKLRRGIVSKAGAHKEVLDFLRRAGYDAVEAPKCGGESNIPSMSDSDCERLLEELKAASLEKEIAAKAKRDEEKMQVEENDLTPEPEEYGTEDAPERDEQDCAASALLLTMQDDRFFSGINNNSIPTVRRRLQPFARVESISRGSPAKEAGFLWNDLILEFGSVTSRNFVNVHDIVEVMQDNVGCPVSIVVRRNSTDFYLCLIPMPWTGNGLLGCSVIPVVR